MGINLLKTDQFEQRHIGSDAIQVSQMLKTIGVSSLDQLIDETVPDNIRLKKKMNLPMPLSEFEFLKFFKTQLQKNKMYKSYIGLGYNNCITPTVILRNILENPGWYTAYTPYQAEIAQGRLEALINYQTMITDLTGMQIANASLLDEATAAAEAMSMLYSVRSASKKSSNKVFISDTCFPQTIDVLKTRAIPLGIELVIANIDKFELNNDEFFCVMVQYPDRNGAIIDYKEFFASCHKKDITIICAADLLALTLIVPPGELGADAVVGNTQRFGVPLGYGGPHAAYLATKDEFKRSLPGRVIGVSIDAQGDRAYRMSLQTREQHIKREKATSNICTAQVLLSVIAGCYAVYHGPEGLKNIANRINGLTKVLSEALVYLGFEQSNEVFFDTIKIEVGELSGKLKMAADEALINFRHEGNYIFISLDETTSTEDLKKIIGVFSALKNKEIDEETIYSWLCNADVEFPSAIARTSDFLQHPVFNKYHTEHEMLRYLKHLENKDLSLVHSMIALGSCTMKLNATSEMIPLTWQEVGGIHPFVPKEQTEGYQELIHELSQWLAEITGFAGISLQPNSGAQGEYAGLMVIRAYHLSRGDEQRNIALIPNSAHGTNPASAVMAGMKVVIVKCDERGNIDVEDLKEKALLYKEVLSCLMVTYPSTHGVFEETIVEICSIIHQYGGQVYMDGANMNAQVGLTSPGFIGADVCHLNLHKTFCIPHGGGGPGMGPIGVAKQLVPFLPGHSIVKTGGEKAITAVSAAPYGSASILTISYAYIAMMGAEGLVNATKHAILNANYIKSRLEKYYPILYTGANGHCAHEFILDCRGFKLTSGVEVEDIAKRLMDYGFHAPTVSFPVAGTLMIEPTESESKEELDKFCDAMISIRKEISEIENGEADKKNNVLKNAPHTAKVSLSDNWDLPYSREKAVYPIVSLKEGKFWPSVSRIDNAYGDRNLVCSCPPIEQYEVVN
ncbi:MAG: glycine dehydrogenase (aminomethyl-transferring) [Cytophagales bacterium]|nr:MAG: glycine dehydrogenase (aminomethyl-transferring) [Cytophagales bacterium]